MPRAFFGLRVWLSFILGFHMPKEGFHYGFLDSEFAGG